jgi:hypothetical protein
MMLFILQLFFQPAVNFSLLRPKTFKHSQFIIFPYVRNQGSHPHKTAVTIMFLCILSYFLIYQMGRQKI